MLVSTLLVIAGIALLYFGGEVLVDNSIRLARSFGISELVIGLTVVAFATSAPELAATLTAAFRGSPDIAIGNVLGSNIANLGLILGMTALVFPLTTSRRFIRREIVFMVLVTLATFPILRSGYFIGRLEGLLLLGILTGFLIVSLRDTGHQPTLEELGEDTGPDRTPLLCALGIAFGVGLLVGGAQALVTGATDIARSFQVPERVIGLTLVALGTSLPELAASVVAARRKKGDLVLGNVIGSNIFNLLCILGLTSLVHPIAVAEKALSLDFWVTFGISAFLLLMLLVRPKLGRSVGVLLLGIYFGYSIYLLALG